jgi:hypothetical protein
MQIKKRSSNQAVPTIDADRQIVATDNQARQKTGLAGIKKPP